MEYALHTFVFSFPLLHVVGLERRVPWLKTGGAAHSTNKVDHPLSHIEVSALITGKILVLGSHNFWFNSTTPTVTSVLRKVAIIENDLSYYDRTTIIHNRV